MTTLQSTTKYALTQLERKLSNGDWPAGELLPSERRIAADLNVSRTPLRAALHELTRRGQLKRNEPRGYLVIGGTTDNLQPMAQTIGILTHVAVDQWEPNTTANRIENGVRTAVIQGGSHLMQFQPTAVDVATIQWMKQQQLAGVVATHEIALNSSKKQMLDSIRQQGIATVVHGNSSCLANFDRVTSDQEQGMYDLTIWLLKQGCRRILRLWGADDPEIYWLQMRNRGYQRAHDEMGITPMPPLHWPSQPIPEKLNTVERCEFLARWSAGYLADVLLQEMHVDAIACVSDSYIEPTGRACEILGLDPNTDLKICGFDNYWQTLWHQFGKLKAPCATVDTQSDTIGLTMVDLLRQRVGKLLPDEPQCKLIPTQLVTME